MTDTTALLQDRALAAAADVFVHMGDSIPVELHRSVLHALAIAWVEGRKAGGSEAQVIIDRLLEQLR